MDRKALCYISLLAVLLSCLVTLLFQPSVALAASPNQPVNVSPIDGATGISLTPTLQCSAFSDPDVGDTHAASQWQIRLDSGTYSSPVYDSGASNTILTSITIPPRILNNTATYYWQVRHRDNQGTWSSYSAETSFTTVPPPPAAPMLVSPANGAIVTDTSVTYEWSPVTGAEDYKLVVSTSSDISRTASYKFNQKVGNTTTYIDSGYPLNGTKYYWWVFAFDAYGSYSLFSEVLPNGRWFINATTYIAAPTLVSPANGAIVTGTSVTFQWSAVENAVDYKLVVSTCYDITKTASYKFNQKVGNTTTYNDSGYPVDGTNYYWWVYAFNADGGYSRFSEVKANGRWFTSRGDSYVAAPPLVSPDNGVIVTDTSVTFEWSPVTGAEDYKLVVSTSSDITKTASYKFNQKVGNTTTYIYSGYPLDGTNYYWWVYAFGSDGTYSLFSEVRANGRWFTTAITYVAAPTLVSPVSVAAPDTSVTFEWSPVAGAVDYKLVVSTCYDITKTAYYKFNQKVGNTTTYADSGYPVNGTKYYWWVYAFAGDGTYSRFSEVKANGRWFFSATSYVAAPTLLSPARGAIISGPSVTFQWSAVENAADYKLVVSTCYDITKTAYYKFNQKVGDVTTYVDTGYDGTTTCMYYWWVYAFAADGTYSRFSEVLPNGRWFYGCGV